MSQRRYRESDWDDGASLRIGRQSGGTIFNKISNIFAPDIRVPRWGPAKPLIVLGIVAAIAGFSMFAYSILRFIVYVFTSMQQEDLPESPDFSFILPWLPLGFSLFLCGIFLIWIGVAGTFLFGRRPDARNRRDTMSDRPSRSRSGGFHIGSQQAEGDINNVQDGSVIYGDRTRSEHYSAAGDLRVVREGVETLPLPPDLMASLRRQLFEAETEAAKADADPRRIGRRLQEVTETLTELGQMEKAGRPVLDALRRLAAWLKPLVPGLLLLLPL